MAAIEVSQAFQKHLQIVANNKHPRRVDAMGYYDKGGELKIVYPDALELPVGVKWFPIRMTLKGPANG